VFSLPVVTVLIVFSNEALHMQLWTGWCCCHCTSPEPPVCCFCLPELPTSDNGVVHYCDALLMSAYAVLSMLQYCHLSTMQPAVNEGLQPCCHNKWSMPKVWELYCYRW